MTDKKKSKQIHVMYDKETKTWYAKQDNAQRKSFAGEKTQKDAEKRADEIAKKQGLERSTHKKDNNAIREKNSYGNDNCPPKG